MVEAISDLSERVGYPPTFREVAEELGMSVGGVYDALVILRDEGRVTWTDDRVRTLRVVTA